MNNPAPRHRAPRRASASGTKGQSRLPQFGALTPEQSAMILARHNVGRIAYAFHDRVGIEPIHYVYENGILHGRTSHGSKLDILAHRPWVAFEVDEVEGLFDWRSVEVQGTFDRVHDDGSPLERAAWEHSVALLSALVPGTMSASDPTAFRTVVFRIHVNEITGRQASS
jgi:nitroimidazol reductase NimA-like FMN-containing flavoprotein (pyridoxamine 5'-phosphate oxidase superfamily)